MLRPETKQIGDTIVEVLIAITIAAFAIAISYATAERSLRQSITARERNEALNLIENQISDFQILKKNFPASLPQFSFPNTNYCINDSAANPSNWAKTNSCKVTVQGVGVTYTINITTSSNSTLNSPTNFVVTATWPPEVGTQTNSASIAYRF